MKAVLALAFLALAQAAIIEVPRDEEITLFEEAPIHPMWMRAMFQKYGFAKPIYDDDFITFARTLGVADPPTMAHLRSLYDEPALLFFEDPVGDVISYFADTGIHHSALVPSTKSVFHDLISASDTMAIAYRPERMLGEYKAVLPGHFFHPVKDSALSRLLAADPVEVPHNHEHAVVFSKAEISHMFPTLRYMPGRFDFEEMPYAYKYPVSLKFDYPAPRSYYAPDSYYYSKPSYYRAEYPTPAYVARVEYPSPAYFRKPEYPYYTKPSYPVVESPAYYGRFEVPYTSAYPYFHRYAYPAPEPYYERSYARAPYIKPIVTVDAPFYGHPLKAVIPRPYRFVKTAPVPAEPAPVVVEAAEPILEKDFDVTSARFISQPINHLARAFPAPFERAFNQVGLKAFYAPAPVSATHVVAEPSLKAFYPPQPVAAHVVAEPPLKAFFSPETVSAHVVNEPALKAFFPPAPLANHIVGEPTFRDMYSPHMPIIAAPL